VFQGLVREVVDYRGDLLRNIKGIRVSQDLFDDLARPGKERRADHETLYHWHRFVRDSFSDLDREVVGERRVFQVRCEAILIDLRAVAEPRLVDRNDYSFTHQVGRHLWQRAQSGLLAPSARSPGVCAAIFRPEVLSDVRDVCFLTYRLRSNRATVERTPGEPWLRITIPG
jgi:hypothetical protein